MDRRCERVGETARTAREVPWARKGGHRQPGAQATRIINARRITLGNIVSAYALGYSDPADDVGVEFADYVSLRRDGLYINGKRYEVSDSD